MSNFNPPQMSLDNNLDPKHTSDHLNHTNVTNPLIFPTTTQTEVSEPSLSTSIEISVTPENKPAIGQDWFNLARKLRKQNRELLENIVQLEQSLAESQQQLQEREQQADQNDSFVIQQTAEVNYIKAKFQAAQEQFQQQELTTLQEKLVTTQSRLAHVERQCTLLKESYLEKANKLKYSQKQVEELQIRLQRQQRYALQYKAALDECLSKSTRKQIQPSIIPPRLAKTFTPKITSIKTWSEQLKAQKASYSILSEAQPKAPLKRIATSNPPKKSEASSSLDFLDQTFEDIFSVVPEIPEATKEIKTDTEEILNQKELKSTSANVDLKTVANHDSHSHEIITPTSQRSAVQPPAPFSFDIDYYNKPHDKAKIDLPSFLSRRR